MVINHLLTGMILRVEDTPQRNYSPYIHKYMSLPLPNGPCRKVFVTSIHFQNGIFCVYLGAKSHLAFLAPPKHKPNQHTKHHGLHRGPVKRNAHGKPSSHGETHHHRGIAIGFALVTRFSAVKQWGGQLMGPKDGYPFIAVIFRFY